MTKLRLRKDLSAETLRDAIDYNPHSGKFFGVEGRYFGKEIGSANHRGYVRVVIGGASYLAHRLAWLYVHGEWPPLLIDHINGDTSDNRIVNLRPATHSQNSLNQKIHRAASLSLGGEA